MSKGKLIAIEGLDGSGKATQAKLLAGYLAAQGLAVREVSFPDYGSDSVHQCSKLPPEQWESFLGWLFDFEFHLLGLPAPDEVIYLQVDPAVSQKLMTQRYHGDESKKDVHEKDTEYLARSRRAAEYCAAHLGWAVVHCTSGDNMRSIEDIQAEVQKIVLKN